MKSDTVKLSCVDTLTELVSKECELVDRVSQFTCVTDDSLVQLALHKVALHTCRLLKSDQAFLFPSLYNEFLSYLPAHIDQSLCVSKSRVLTYLANEFGKPMSSFCHHKQVGTIFHRSSTDPYMLLSIALAKQPHEGQDNTSQVLNKSVHCLIEHLTNDNSSIDAFMDTVNEVAPDLWKHVVMLTQSVNEQKGRKAALESSKCIKRVRRAYLLSAALFITNSTCSAPFHVLLSDSVETCGGSTELITVLNKVGAVSSVDTFKRVVNFVSHERRIQGVRSLLVDKAFTVTSTDNIDFLKSHAAVYSGSQHRSWYANSIQLFQSKPLTRVIQRRSDTTYIQTEF